ncbi:inorganic phosphate transporter [Tenacibaculum maritimum]|uniref:inorganic phosphate transporter n=1 Tax=Tenacibaculum maritimum TaxID=107401 RepID=UPI0012E56B77|nr:inorganic phosphate transporter [Tenacibaculum maritimum]MCD9581396.1 inorganic phosphate transporter family protein [Tenacibaculum maritimum]MCD9635652.1 inorganic phosphate transporter family protein [Tenacibaculum maritimum]CAA0188316.1 Phosphate transporter [Tenacibaculum maritimum]
MILLLLFIAACFLAYSNGANDNFKGVATLFGAGITNYKKAINWATITTFSGSVAAIFLAKELVKNFSGKGLVPNELIQTPNFAIAIALGAALTVFAATKIGMPISTTHGLVGGLFGAGVMAVGSDFNFGKLGNTFLIPLIVSPLMAAILSLLAYLLFKFIKKQIPSLHTKNPTLFGISAPKILDRLHYLSAGIVSFARGLNDTPKIVGLLIIINTIDIKWSMISVAVIMSLGGLLNAKKVGETMSKKITKMNSGQGFTANIVTGLLVTTASVHGLPVSTTHVSVGSLFGIGTATKKADYKVIGKIILSWVLTLPIAAIMSAVIFKVLQVVA